MAGLIYDTGALIAAEGVDFTSQTAYAVGELLAAAGSADVVDAVVVLLAARHGDIIVTSDPDDLGQLAAALGVRLALRPI
jgi:predicted nucleic acid-binding protein